MSLESVEGKGYCEKLLKALDELRAKYYVDEYVNEDGVRITEVRLPLDDEHLPRRIPGKKVEPDDESFLFEFLLALLKRMGMKKQYNLLKSWGDIIRLRLKYWSFPAALKGIEDLFGVKFGIPYFEPFDLTWYWKIPCSGS
jgi:hypothetical protein